MVAQNEEDFEIEFKKDIFPKKQVWVSIQAVSVRHMREETENCAKEKR
jgi:hypothetical protein